MKKRDALAAVEERLGRKRSSGPETSVFRQIRCVLTWPFIRHAYDAIFIRRPEKKYGRYEHCACCGRARSWVSLGTNYDRPGATEGQSREREHA